MAPDDSIARWKEHAYPLKQITIKLQGIDIQIMKT
jgi:hypothetical protein